MKVKEILAKYPAGTLLAVWVRSFGGPSYLGVFIVAKRTLVYVGTFRKWGEIAKEIARNNKIKRLVITEAKVLPGWATAAIEHHAGGPAGLASAGKGR